MWCVNEFYCMAVLIAFVINVVAVSETDARTYIFIIHAFVKT